MKNRDSNDALTAMLAMFADVCFIWIAQMLAVWIRFDSGWIHLPFGRDVDLYTKYALAAVVVLPIHIFVFQLLKLYSRPQEGVFSNKIPRIVRACAVSELGVLVVNSLLKNVAPYSNGVILVSFATVILLVLLERAVMFQLEIVMARRSAPYHRTLIVGAGEDAARLAEALASDPRLRTRAAGVLVIDNEVPHAAIPPELLCGDFSDLAKIVAQRQIDQLILTGHSLPHAKIIELILFCEQHLIRFNMVPDLFRMLTSHMEFQLISGIPLLGVSRWPLDQVWNRMTKRTLDIFGALFGLLLSSPIMLVAAFLITRESPGPIFYIQERCGRRGTHLPPVQAENDVPRRREGPPTGLDRGG